MDWHVHVYELKAKGEIELSAESEKEALTQALTATKEGKVICDQKPETKHMALAFPGKRNQKEPATDIQAYDVACEGLTRIIDLLDQHLGDTDLRDEEIDEFEQPVAVAMQTAVKLRASLGWTPPPSNDEAEQC